MNVGRSENLSEKSFLTLIATSIVSILLCMACLCSVTWAWFGQDHEQTLRFSADPLILDVTVVDGEGIPMVEYAYVHDGESEMSKEGSNAMIVQTEEGESTFNVTLTLAEGSASGYCKIIAKYADGAVREYFTDTLARGDGETEKSMTFSLAVKESVSLTFLPRFGTVAHSDMAEGKLSIGR